MAKYIRDYDNEIFDEDEIGDAVEETIDDDIIDEAMQDFTTEWLFSHLNEEAQWDVYDRARAIALRDCFAEVDDDEVDDDDEEDE